jgi:hypothetical protein
MSEEFEQELESQNDANKRRVDELERENDQLSRDFDKLV